MIGFEGVSKSYRGGRLALDDVTFAVPAGGSLGLVGESGSGKTTCVRLALGLDTAHIGAADLQRHRLSASGAASCVRCAGRSASCCRIPTTRSTRG